MEPALPPLQPLRPRGAPEGGENEDGWRTRNALLFLCIFIILFRFLFLLLLMIPSAFAVSSQMTRILELSYSQVSRITDYPVQLINTTYSLPNTNYELLLTHYELRITSY